MGTIGLDIGITAGGVLAWGVLAPTAGPMRGKLAGTYVGASGAVGVGVGVGANLLFGGSNRSIALQPLSVEGSVGINLSLGSFKSHACSWHNEDISDRTTLSLHREPVSGELFGSEPVIRGHSMKITMRLLAKSEC